MPPEFLPILQTLPQLGVSILVIYFFMIKLDVRLREQTEAIDRNTKATLTAQLTIPNLPQSTREIIEGQVRVIEEVAAVREAARRIAQNRTGGGV